MVIQIVQPTPGQLRFCRQISITSQHNFQNSNSLFLTCTFTRANLFSNPHSRPDLNVLEIRLLLYYERTFKFHLRTFFISIAKKWRNKFEEKN